MIEQWRAELDSPLDEVRAAAIASDTVVVGVHTTDPEAPAFNSDRPHHLLGLDRATGARRWRVELAPYAMASHGQIIASAGDLVVMIESGERGSRLVAFSASTGEEQWTRKIGRTPYADGAVALIDGELVVVAGSAVAVCDLSGNVLRESKLPRIAGMTIAPGPGGDYLLTSFKGSKTMLRIAHESLEEVWSLKVPGGWSAPTPVVVQGDTAIFHSYAAMALGLDAATGEIRWRRKKVSGRTGICLPLPNGDVVWGTSDLARARVSDGKDSWKVAGVAAATVLDDGKIAVAKVTGTPEHGETGELHVELLDAATGTAVDRLSLGDTEVNWVADDKAREPFVASPGLIVSGLQVGSVVAIRPTP